MTMPTPEFDGRDLEEALSAASAALGRPAADLDYELIEEGRKGVFGLGARPVRIRVRLEAGAAPASSGGAPAPAPRATPQGRPAAMLERMIALSGLALTIRESLREGSTEISLDGADRKRLTARDGELLEALEFVLNRMGRRQWPDDPPVHLVCDGFQSSRDGELIEMIREVAARVARSGAPERLQPMNAYERRIVHVTVREFPGLTTVSEGDGFLKRVRVQKAGG
jgi:spoIIIJ-associated protein